MTNPEVCISFWQCVFAYQTLITGLVALAAAGAAAWVAWRQLGRMTIQSNGLVRAALQEQLQGAVRRQRAMIEGLAKISQDIQSRIWEVETYQGQSIHPEWAASRENECDALLERMKKFRDRQLGTAVIDAKVEIAEAALSKLSMTLATIHRPVSTDQHDEDRSYTDRQWKEIEQQAAQAEEELSSVADRYSETIKPIDEAFAEEIKLLRSRIKKIDEHLKATDLD